jgi:hypothetical protein
MEKRLKNYLKYIDSIVPESLTLEERHAAKAELLVQIHFFQHERMIHLLVTLAFAIMTMSAFFISLQYHIMLLYILLLVLLILLIPYIRHYYILENGVQKLYEYYDRLTK